MSNPTRESVEQARGWLKVRFSLGTISAADAVDLEPKLAALLDSVKEGVGPMTDQGRFGECYERQYREAREGRMSEPTREDLERADKLAGPHLYDAEDPWWSCGLAVEWDGDSPGSGCSKEAARGRCTCNRAARAARLAAEFAATREQAHAEGEAAERKRWEEIVRDVDDNYPNYDVEDEILRRAKGKEGA